MKPSQQLPCIPLPASDGAGIPPYGVLATSRGGAARRRLRPCLAGAGIRQPRTWGHRTAAVPSFIALAMVLASPTSALAASTENQPVHLDNTLTSDTHIGGGGS